MEKGLTNGTDNTNIKEFSISIGAYTLTILYITACLWSWTCWSMG